MTGCRSVFRRELKAYLASPASYVFLVIFLFLASWMAFRDDLFEARQASLRAFFQNIPFILALFAPALAMRLWSEERRIGTIELLFTLPITVPAAVLGKFLAAWAFFAIALLLTTPLALSVAWLGDPDNGPIMTGYLGSLLLAGVNLTIAGFFSTLSKNQVICFVLGTGACALVLWLGSPSVLDVFHGWLPNMALSFLESLSIQAHFESMQRGVLEMRSLLAFIFLMLGFLGATVVVLADRKGQ